MHKQIFIFLLTILLIACEELVELPSSRVEVVAVDLDVDSLKVTGMLNGLGDGIKVFGHVWSTDGSTKPVYSFSDDSNQNEFTNPELGIPFTSTLPQFEDETSYRVRAFAISIYDSIYYSDELVDTKIISFTKTHSGFEEGTAIRSLEDGSFLIGTRLSTDNTKSRIIKTDKYGELSLIHI